jgi:spermidine synthase
MDIITIEERSDPSYTLSYTGSVLGSNSIATGNPQDWVVLHGAAGTMLFIDGQHQSTLEDEYIYHETFVQSLMWRLPSRKRVLILGGAEGCLAREVLRWQDVKEVVQVDWDKSLVDFFREPEQRIWNNGAYDDSRISLVHEDASAWLKDYSGDPFDVIFIDLLDPSSSDDLQFLTDIVKMCKTHLASRGGLSCNVGQVSPIKRSFGCYLAESFQTLFQAPYFHRTATKAFVPSYLGEWAFCMAIPYGWSRGHTVPLLPHGLKRSPEHYTFRRVEWSSDYPQVFQKFGKLNEEESAALQKLTVCPPLHINKDIADYYGC